MWKQMNRREWDSHVKLSIVASEFSSSPDLVTTVLIDTDYSVYTESSSLANGNISAIQISLNLFGTCC